MGPTASKVYPTANPSLVAKGQGVEFSREPKKSWRKTGFGGKIGGTNLGMSWWIIFFTVYISEIDLYIKLRCRMVTVSQAKVKFWTPVIKQTKKGIVSHLK